MRQRLVTPENKKWWTLAAVSVGLFMIMLDNTVVNVALPSIRSSLGLSLSELEWVVAGYALTFAAFMLTGGKLADLLGRRLIFMVGPRRLHRRLARVRARPERRLPDRRARRAGPRRRADEPGDALDHHRDVPAAQRGTAIGIWAGVSAMALAIGPLVGGLLTEHVNWNWIFFINVPIGIAGLLAVAAPHRRVARHVRASSASTCPGSSTSAIGLFALTYAFIEANSYGWTSCADPRRVRRRRGLARRVRRARAAPARCRCSTSRCSATARSAARTRRCSSSASRCSGRSSTSRSTCRTSSATRPCRPGRRSCR